MSWNQTIGFNQSKASNRAGYCLQDTRLGFGIKVGYGSAWKAWQHTQQHFDTPPMGVDVPVYFSYIDEDHGHIGVRLANGEFWSEGTRYTSIMDYTKRHDPKYVGWGESINDVQVLKWVPDAPPSRVIHLPADSGLWHGYFPEGPYTKASGKWKGILNPGKFGGLSYVIKEDKGNGIYVVTTQNFGDVALYTSGSKFTIS